MSPAPERTATRLVIVPVVVAVSLIAVTISVLYSGAVAAPPNGISDAGAGVRWALPLVRAVSDLAGALTLGALVFAANLIPGRSKKVTEAPDEPRRETTLKVATGAGFIWALCSLLGTVLLFADASGLSLTYPSFGAEFIDTVWKIDLLRVGLISAILAGVAATGAALARTRGAAACLVVVAVVGLLILGLGGHAGGSADHETAVNALAIHILAAALWVGGLLTLVILRPTLGSRLPVVASRYSTIALWCFIALGISGIMSATTRLRGFGDLTTEYGVLILVKSLGFVALGVAGWWHRERTLKQLDAAEHGPDGAAASRGPFLRLAVGELIVMGIAFGVATALARTAPPVPRIPPTPSVALNLTGFPAPPAPTAASWITAWRVEWLFLAVALLAIGCYLFGVIRLNRRGDSWPVGRTIAWVVGWLLFIWATNGVLGIYGRVSFSWHMTLHMLEAMVIPIFLVLGAPITLALRTLKARRDGTLGPRELILAVIHSSVMKAFANPIVAGALFFISLVIFYWTGLFNLALSTHTGHLLMTAHFILTGYLFAWVLIGIDPGPKKWSPALRLIVLFATITFHAFFGVAIVSGTSLLAPEFFTPLAIEWVPDLLQDQRNGGSVAWAIGEVPSLVLALVVAIQWYRSDRDESRRLDRKADRDGDAELAAYNERLGKIAQHDAT